MFYLIIGLDQSQVKTTREADLAAIVYIKIACTHN
jgi:hypothetical protein